MIWECERCEWQTPRSPETAVHPFKCSQEIAVGSRQAIEKRYVEYFADGRDSLVKTRYETVYKTCGGTYLPK